MGKMYRARYLKDAYFDALESLKGVVVRNPPHSFIHSLD